MKKSLFILLFFGMCTLASARVVIQVEGTGIGSDFNWEKNVIPKRSWTSEAKYEWGYGMMPSLMWEFNSKNKETPIHFFTGASFGFAAVGIPVALEGGFTYRLFDLGLVSFDLNGTMQCGVYSEIYGGCDLWTGYSADFVCNAFDRRVYAGIGIGNWNYSIEYILKDYGAYWYHSGFIGGHIMAGIRI